MNRDLWLGRFARLKKLGLLAVLGLAVTIIGLITKPTTLAIGVLLLVPGLVYLYVLTILHWKDRYRGRHSDLWGVLILIETTGWFKLVYLFRHLIPDARRVGRYESDSSPT